MQDVRARHPAGEAAVWTLQGTEVEVLLLGPAVKVSRDEAMVEKRSDLRSPVWGVFPATAMLGFHCHQFCNLTAQRDASDHPC